MRRGLATGLLGVALLLAAALLGSVALFAFALGLLALFWFCLVATTLGARRLAIERTVGADEVLEGRPLTLGFRVRGLAALPVHAEVRDDDGRWQRLGRDLSRTCTIERPGPHLVGPSVVRVRDDLGLFASRPRPAGEPAVVLVLPQPTIAAIQSAPPGVDPGGDPEPDGLQPYQRGTTAGRIHWPSVARAGEWQERRVITSPRGMPLVVVDLAGAKAEGAIDWTLRAAAGQIHGLACAGGCRVLLPGERRPVAVENVADGWPAMHRRLAALRGAVGGKVAAAAPGAIHIRAALAPEIAVAGSGPLPPEVVPLERTDLVEGGHGRRG